MERTNRKRPIVAGIHVEPGGSVQAQTINVHLPMEKLPSTIRMMQPTNANFLGRNGEMEEIHKQLNKLSRNKSPLLRMIVLTGPQGIGKTSFAQKFAEDYSKEYPNVIFLDAGSEQSLNASFLELAAELNLIDLEVSEGGGKKPNIDARALLEKIYASISEHYASSLIIFDNAESLDSQNDLFGIYEFLPKRDLMGMPMFLVTSRNDKNWSSQEEHYQVHTFPLTLLTDDEAKEIILRGYELGPNVSSRLQNLAAKIVSILGGYPLGLSLLRNVDMGRRGGRISEMEIARALQDFARKLEMAEKEMHKDKDGNVEDFQFKLLQVIFDKKLEDVGKTAGGEDAIEILGIIGNLNPDFIDISLCYRIFYQNPYSYYTSLEKIGGRFEEAFQILQQNNFILVYDQPFKNNETNERVKVHRAIQNLSRLRLKIKNDWAPLENTITYFESQEYVFEEKFFANVSHAFRTYLNAEVVGKSLVHLIRLWVLETKNLSYSRDLRSIKGILKKLEEKLAGCSSKEYLKCVELGRLSIQSEWDHWSKEPGNKKDQIITDIIFLVGEVVKCLQDCSILSLCVRFIGADSKGPIYGLSPSNIFNVAKLCLENLRVITEKSLPRDTLSASILTIVSKCWKATASHGDVRNVCTCVYKILVGIYSPQSYKTMSKYWDYFIQTFLRLNKFHYDQFAEGFLLNGGRDLISNALHEFDEFLVEQDTQYLEKEKESAYSDITNAIYYLAVENEQAGMFADSEEFLESFHHFTYQASFVDAKYKGYLTRQLLLLWVVVEAKKSSGKDIIGMIESLMREFMQSKENERFLWPATWFRAKILDEYLLQLDYDQHSQLVLEFLKHVSIISDSPSWLCRFDVAGGGTQLTTVPEQQCQQFQLLQSEVLSRLQSLTTHSIEGTLAREILIGLSFLEPGGTVSWEKYLAYFHPKLAHENFTEERSRIETCAEILKTQGLISLLDNEFYLRKDVRIHPFVQTVVRKSLENEEALKYLSRLGENLWAYELERSNEAHCFFEYLNERKDDLRCPEYEALRMKFWTYARVFSRNCPSTDVFDKTGKLSEENSTILKLLGSESDFESAMEKILTNPKFLRDNLWCVSLMVEILSKIREPSFPEIPLDNILRAFDCYNKYDNFPADFNITTEGDLMKFRVEKISKALLSCTEGSDFPVDFIITTIGDQENYSGMTYTVLTLQINETHKFSMRHQDEISVGSRVHWLLELTQSYLSTRMGSAGIDTFWHVLQKDLHGRSFCDEDVLLDLFGKYLKHALEYKYPLNRLTPIFCYIRKSLFNERIKYRWWNSASLDKTVEPYCDFIQKIVSEAGFSPHEEYSQSLFLTWFLIFRNLFSALDPKNNCMMKEKNISKDPSGIISFPTASWNKIVDPENCVVKKETMKDPTGLLSSLTAILKEMKGDSEKMDEKKVSCVQVILKNWMEQVDSVGSTFVMLQSDIEALGSILFDSSYKEGSFTRNFASWLLKKIPLSPEFLDSLLHFTRKNSRKWVNERDKEKQVREMYKLRWLFLFWFELEQKSRDKPLKVLSLIESEAKKWIFTVHSHPHYLWIDASVRFSDLKHFFLSPGSQRMEDILDCAKHLAIFSSRTYFDDMIILDRAEIDPLHLAWFKEEFQKNYQVLQDGNELYNLEVLTNLAFFEPSGVIPWSIYENIFGSQIHNEAEKSKLEAALDRLEDLNFLSASRNNDRELVQVFIHPITQALVREQAPPDNTVKVMDCFANAFWSHVHVKLNANSFLEFVLEKWPFHRDCHQRIVLRVWLYIRYYGKPEDRELETFLKCQSMLDTAELSLGERCLFQMAQAEFVEGETLQLMRKLLENSTFLGENLWCVNICFQLFPGFTSWESQDLLVLLLETLKEWCEQTGDDEYSVEFKKADEKSEDWLFKMCFSNSKLDLIQGSESNPSINSSFHWLLKFYFFRIAHVGGSRGLLTFWDQFHDFQISAKTGVPSNIVLEFFQYTFQRLQMDKSFSSAMDFSSARKSLQACAIPDDELCLRLDNLRPLMDSTKIILLDSDSNSSVDDLMGLFLTWIAILRGSSLFATAEVPESTMEEVAGEMVALWNTSDKRLYMHLVTFIKFKLLDFLEKFKGPDLPVVSGDIEWLVAILSEDKIPHTHIRHPLSVAILSSMRISHSVVQKFLECTTKALESLKKSWRLPHFQWIIAIWFELEKRASSFLPLMKSHMDTWISNFKSRPLVLWIDDIFRFEGVEHFAKSPASSSSPMALECGKYLSIYSSAPRHSNKFSQANASSFLLKWFKSEFEMKLEPFKLGNSGEIPLEFLTKISLLGPKLTIWRMYKCIFHTWIHPNSNGQVTETIAEIAKTIDKLASCRLVYLDGAKIITHPYAQQLMLQGLNPTNNSKYLVEIARGIWNYGFPLEKLDFYDEHLIAWYSEPEVPQAYLITWLFTLCVDKKLFSRDDVFLNGKLTLEATELSPPNQCLFNIALYLDEGSVGKGEGEILLEIQSLLNHDDYLKENLWCLNVFFSVMSRTSNESSKEILDMVIETFARLSKDVVSDDCPIKLAFEYTENVLLFFLPMNNTLRLCTTVDSLESVGEFSKFRSLLKFQLAWLARAGFVGVSKFWKDAENLAERFPWLVEILIKDFFPLTLNHLENIISFDAGNLGFIHDWRHSTMADQEEFKTFVGSFSEYLLSPANDFPGNKIISKVRTLFLTWLAILGRDFNAQDKNQEEKSGQSSKQKNCEHIHVACTNFIKNEILKLLKEIHGQEPIELESLEKDFESFHELVANESRHFPLSKECAPWFYSKATAGDDDKMDVE